MAVSTYAVLHDYITLPIIISDWDAIQSNKRRSSEAAAGRMILPGERTTTTATTVTARKGCRERWSTGFSDYIDGVWRNMSEGMRQKLREACVEVLRRTDGVSDDQMFEHLDDDARFLD